MEFIGALQNSGFWLAKVKLTCNRKGVLERAFICLKGSFTSSI